MINYQGVRIKLTNTQLNNLNSASKKKYRNNIENKQEKRWKWNLH